MVLESGAALAGASSGAGLYEWSQGSTLTFVSMLPEGHPASSVALGYYHTRAHAISNDGSRVFWTASQETPAHLYMRNTVAGARTIQLDKAQEGLTEPTGRRQVPDRLHRRLACVLHRHRDARRRARPANRSGKSATCTSVKSRGAALQKRCTLRDLTIPLRADERGAVQGFMLGSSEDGSTVYLVAHGVLAENENANGEAAEPGADEPVRAPLRHGQRVDAQVHRAAVRRRQPRLG